MIRQAVISIAVSASLATIVGLANAADVAELIKPCVECHGSNGVATLPGVPHLNGQNEYYLFEEIEHLHHGKRSKRTSVKAHVPKEYKKADWTAIAKHYAGSDPARPKQTVDPERVARGEKIYLDRCESCHIDNGRDYDPSKNQETPRMAGQDPAYLLAESKAFNAGLRNFALDQDRAFKGLSDEQLEDVAHYFAAQESRAPTVTSEKKRPRKK